MERIPNDYRDESWTKMSTAVETKLGIPPGLLTTVVNHGEKSNNDQVSEKGARTPFQIIPETRNAVLKKYGVDAYLSPENAAEAAGLLLKESLDRNKGNPAIAVAEYHGGTNRDNWGPKTKSYVARVMSNLPKGEQQDPLAASPEEQSTFDKALAEKKTQPQASSQIKQIYDAYVTGQMNDQEKADFEADVRDGKIMLPKGASIGDAPAPTDQASTAVDLPKEVVDAYTTDKMSRQEKIDLENDVKNGIVKLPPGVELQNTEHLGAAASVGEAITGSDRQTEETATLKPWQEMPELNSINKEVPKNEAGLPLDPLGNLKTNLKELVATTASPEEALKILKTEHPNMQVRQDAKGNYVIKSAIDGQEYVVPPGFSASDVPRVASAVTAFSGTGAITQPLKSAAVNAGIQSVIEGTQSAAGGNFDTADVVAAGAIPVALQGVKAVATPIVGAAKNALGRGAAPVVEAADVAVQQADNLPPVPIVPLKPDELTQTAKAAAGGGFGSGQATETLAAQAAPDVKIVDAAKRLGIEDYLQPDHVTTNQAYRELSQAIKSVPGSTARASELEGLKQVAKKADDIITQIGGTDDLSQVSAATKSSLQATQQELEAQANTLYGQLREIVPAKAPAPAENVLTFIKQRADDLGGQENLSPTERMILKKLSPKSEPMPVPTDPKEIEAGLKSGKLSMETDGSGNPIITSTKGTSLKQPTYTLLDDVRRDLTAARIKGAGPFKDADSGLIKKLESELKKDQRLVVGQHGAEDIFTQAQTAVAIRKGIEDDLTALFGKQMDNSMQPKLTAAIKALPAGDSQKLVKLIQSVPEDMRQNVVASGISTAFGKSVKNGDISFPAYANWYEGLLRNKQSHAAIMTNLPAGSRKMLSDLYRVSKGVSSASKERIATGRIQAIKEEFQGTDSLMSNIYSLAKRSAGGLGAEAVTTSVGLPGAGLSAGIASALTKGKPNVLKAADTLIASPEFMEAVKASAAGNTKLAAKRLSFSKPFIKFARALKNPKEMSNREKWIEQALQVTNTTAPKEERL